MAVSKKLRFDVLSRDNHCCMYCGRKPPCVMLEVDHIIPKKKGGSDVLDNLITSCFDCNRGKGGQIREESDGKLYKKDIESIKIKIKDYLYNKWNRNYMGTISKDTYILLKMYIDTIINYYNIQENISIDNYFHNKENTYDTFITSSIYRKEILEWLLNNGCVSIDEMIEYIYDKENRNRNSDEDYGGKINYRLTEELKSIYDEKDYYVIRKFTQFSRLLDEK